MKWYSVKTFFPFQVYNNPLEDYFDNFEDIATTMVLYRGKGSREEGETEGQVIGKLKVSFRP